MKLLLVTFIWMADCMQFLSENWTDVKFLDSSVFDQKFVFPHIPNSSGFRRIPISYVGFPSSPSLCRSLSRKTNKKYLWTVFNSIQVFLSTNIIIIILLYTFYHIYQFLCVLSWHKILTCNVVLVIFPYIIITP